MGGFLLCFFFREGARERHIVYVYEYEARGICYDEIRVHAREQNCIERVIKTGVRDLVRELPPLRCQERVPLVLFE